MYDQSEELDKKYWETLRNKSDIAGITLDASITQDDFVAYGNRLADKQIEMFKTFTSVPLDESTVLDVGCGLGRILKPFSKVFKFAVGIDINQQILEAASVYLEKNESVELVQNDGRSIPFEDEHFDCVYSGGVLQHIPEISVITNYFREGLRVLKPGGVLNYSIQTWMKSRQGGVDGDRVGAKVLASDIETIINEIGHDLLAILSDPKDPIPHFNIIIRKTDKTEAQQNILKRAKKPISIKPEFVTNTNVRTGIFEDLASYENHRKIWSNTQRPITFFEKKSFFAKFF